MKFITVSELKQRATQVVAEIEATGEEVVVTKNGKPVVLIQSIADGVFSYESKKKGGE